MTLDLDAVLVPGRWDPAGVLATWLLRRSVWTWLWVGLIVTVATGAVESPEQLDTQVSSVAEARQLVSTPGTLLLAMAPAARLLAGWLALALAFPLARRLQLAADLALDRPRWHPVSWLDRARLMSGLRAVRWTSTVRRRARQRLGRAGTVVRIADVVLMVTAVALLPAAIATIAARFG